MPKEKSKKDLLLRSALELFVSSGFENSPTAKIAKNAGVATGTLFHYFPSKEVLINELYLEIKKEMVNAMKKDLDQAMTIRQKIACLWTNIIRWDLENPEKDKFFAMYGTSSYIMNSTHEEGMKHYRFAIDIFEQGIREEVLKNLPIELMINTVMGLLNGTVRYFQINRELFEQKDIRDQAFVMFWDAIKG